MEGTSSVGVKVHVLLPTPHLFRGQRLSLAVIYPRQKVLFQKPLQEKVPYSNTINAQREGEGNTITSQVGFGAEGSLTGPQRSAAYSYPRLSTTPFMETYFTPDHRNYQFEMQLYRGEK